MFLLASLLQGKNIWGDCDRQATKKGKHLSYCFIFLSFLSFFVIMAARYMVGTDYYSTYVVNFERASTDNLESSSWEPLFKLFYRLLVKVTDNPQWVFIITSFVIVFCLWFAIYKLSPIPWLSVVIFVCSRHFFIAMNGVRQYVGLACVAIAMVFLARNNPVGYFIMVMIGIMCHYSTAVFLPLYFLCKVKIKPIYIVTIIVITSLLPILPYLSEAIVQSSVYSHYIGSAFDLPYRYDTSVVFQILFILGIIVYILGKVPLKDNEILLRYLVNLYFLCVFLSLNLNLFPNSIRIVWSLEMPVMLLLPCLINRLQNKTERAVISCTVIALYGYFMVNRILAGDHECIPYGIRLGEEIYYLI